MANNDFGTKFFDEISLTTFDGDNWSETVLQPSDSLSLHPASHALHYGSSCFEGIKAFRSADNDVYIFRIDDHIKRMQNSARGLYLPVPDAKQLKSMIIDLLAKYKQQIPEFPSSAYIRPTLLGADPALGRAASPSKTAILFVIISPVGDYFSSSDTMRVFMNTEDLRCSPHIGSIKSGGNYASALGLVMKASEKYQAQQVIFAPNGDVQETAAANCLLINDNAIITKGISTEFLPGITRDSILQLAKLLGYEINERNITADELIEWSKNGEIALSGTAAVLTPVDEVVYKDKMYTVNNGNVSKNTIKLRQLLNNIQCGISEGELTTLKDKWLTKV